jgi:hypothetical protein
VGRGGASGGSRGAGRGGGGGRGGTGLARAAAAAAHLGLLLRLRRLLLWRLDLLLQPALLLLRRAAGGRGWGPGPPLGRAGQGARRCSRQARRAQGRGKGGAHLVGALPLLLLSEPLQLLLLDSHAADEPFVAGGIAQLLALGAQQALEGVHACCLSAPPGRAGARPGDLLRRRSSGHGHRDEPHGPACSPRPELEPPSGLELQLEQSGIQSARPG